MALNNYLSKSELTNLISGQYSGSDQIKRMMAKQMSGIEGLPYQFMENADRRVTGTEIGRKYSEKIISRLPLLFLTPCEPKFMDDFGSEDTSVLTNLLLDRSLNIDQSLLSGSGKYYSVQFDYDTYYQYLNCMLSSVAAYLGIYDTKVKINGTRQKLGTVSWQNELNSEFKTFFSSAENLIFYLDGLTSVSESFTNQTTESSLASQINGFADNANEIKFLFGQKGSGLANIIDGASDIVSSVTSSLSNVIGTLGGGIVESLSTDGVSTVLDGGKIIFPQIWSDSSYDRSYSIDIKLRSPDHDSVSIFLNILKPYCKLLALTLPRMLDNKNPNAYRSPFLVKAFSKGLFNIDMGIISSLSVTKGAECCWNDDGLPTQIDINVTIQDMYSSLVMSGFDDKLTSVVSNTSYMDYLANMAGLNIAQMEIGRKLTMYYYLTQTRVTQTPARLYTQFDNSVSNLIGKIYNLTS